MFVELCGWDVGVLILTAGDLSPKQNNSETKASCLKCRSVLQNLAALRVSSITMAHISRSQDEDEIFGIIHSNKSQAPGESCSWRPCCFSVMFLNI